MFPYLLAMIEIVNSYRTRGKPWSCGTPIPGSWRFTVQGEPLPPESHGAKRVLQASQWPLVTGEKANVYPMLLVMKRTLCMGQNPTEPSANPSFPDAH